MRIQLFQGVTLSVELIVNSIPFDYPSEGEDPGWGGPATSWAEEVTKVLNNVLGPDDILQTTFNVANNQIVVQDITGLLFNAGTVRAATIQYAIYRISTANPSGYTEAGEIHVVYDNAVGWSFAVGGVVGNSGVNFSITPAGQFQYTSNDINSLGYSGVMKFRAVSLSQA